jgi:hypothetical protein
MNLLDFAAMSRTTGQSGDVIARVIAALSELDPQEQARALRAITSFFDHAPIPAQQSSPARAADPAVASVVGAFSADRRPTAKAFLHEKQPRTDVERMACLGYYLAHFRDLPQFKTDDLTKLNTEAAQAKFSNASFAAANALKTGYLAPGDKGKRQLSATGERFVEALPDRDAARRIMAARASRKRRARASSGSK